MPKSTWCCDKVLLPVAASSSLDLPCRGFQQRDGGQGGGCKVDGCWIDSGVEVVLMGRVVLVHVVQACLLRLGHKGSILSLKLPSFFV